MLDYMFPTGLEVLETRRFHNRFVFYCFALDLFSFYFRFLFGKRGIGFVSCIYVVYIRSCLTLLIMLLYR